MNLKRSLIAAVATACLVGGASLAIAPTASATANDNEFAWAYTGYNYTGHQYGYWIGSGQQWFPANTLIESTINHTANAVCLYDGSPEISATLTDILYPGTENNATWELVTSWNDQCP
jgi:hypothetical protein